MVFYSEHDESDAVAAYWPLYERYARRFVGVNGAEFDDLVQESAIASWLAMRAGYKPSKVLLVRTCMRWCRSLNVGGWRLVAEG
jgi:DNA-directed RNA polymerase specialized sigma24 family protein